MGEVSEHELSHLKLFVILDKQKSKLFVDDRCIGVFSCCELIQQTK